MTAIKKWWEERQVQTGIDWFQLFCHIMTYVMLAIPFQPGAGLFQFSASVPVRYETDRPRMQFLETALIGGYFASRLFLEFAFVGYICVAMNIVLNGGQITRALFGVVGATFKVMGTGVQKVNTVLDWVETPKDKIAEQPALLESARNLLTRPLRTDDPSQRKGVSPKHQDVGNVVPLRDGVSGRNTKPRTGTDD